MSWPFSDPTDLDRCVKSLSSSLNGKEARLVSSALAPSSSGAARTPVPYPAWALRLGTLFPGAASPERFAAAVALLTSPSVEYSACRAPALALALALLEQLGVRRDAIARVLLESQLLADAQAEVPGAEALQEKGLPRNLAILLGLSALIAKADPLPWLRFAAALAEPVALLGAIIDLVDESPPQELPPPRLLALLRACSADAGAHAALLAGCAGGFRYPKRIAELRAAVGSEAILRQLGTHRQASLLAAHAALPEKNAAPAQALLEALAERFAALEGELWTRALLARALCSPSPADLPAQAAVGLQAAVSCLEDNAPWRGAWDVHRFHPMGAPGVLIGRGFIEGLILLALSEVGRQKQTAIEALIAEVPDGDARYFLNFSGLPPDADSLGLLLQLAARLAAPPRPRLDGFIAVLEASLDETQIVPVWFERGPQGKTASQGGPFLGNDCTAVRLAFLLGAVRYDPDRFAPLLGSNLRAMLPRCDGHGFVGCVHYGSSFALHLFLRLAQALCASTRPALRQLCAELELPGLLLRCAKSLAARQRIDGSWGSPQETALALEALAPLPSSPEQMLLRAMKYLGDTQSPDGSWPAEPLYITPGKYGGMVPLSTKEVTTALCARALHAGCVRFA